MAPLQAHEVSTFGIADRVTAISRAGWNGLGIGQDDLALIDHTMGFPRLRQIIADAGLKYTHLEVMTGWWSEEGESDQARSREELLLRAANDLGAQHIKATAALEQRRASLDYLASAIEPLIIRASDAGVNIALEPLPFSQVPTLATGAQMVEALGRANFGLVVDSWAVFNGTESLPAVASALQDCRVFAVELNDGNLPRSKPLFEESSDCRLLCGEGDFNLLAFVDMLVDYGFDGPWSVEILSTHHRALPLQAAVEEPWAAAMRVLNNAGVADYQDVKGGNPR